MKISTPAFVLKTSIFKESSLIVRLFTLEKGKATYIIKAAMRQKSPNKAIYQ
jgi:recombinational DNA repair protein (RecF pathway)